jgi:hypothetical protein
MTHTPERCMCGANDCPRCFPIESRWARRYQAIIRAEEQIRADPERVKYLAFDFWECAEGDEAVELLRKIAYADLSIKDAQAGARKLLDRLIREHAEAEVDTAEEAGGAEE